MYMAALATKWMEERGTAQKGVKYTLDKLPEGYKLYGKTRQNDSNHVDRYLCGHPSGYKFRSTTEFYDHFRCLMDNGNINGCTCVACVKKQRLLSASKPKKTTASAVKTPAATAGRKPVPTSATPVEGRLSMPKNQSTTGSSSDNRPPTPDHEKVDEEGTPDVYRMLIDKLREKGALDEPIVEELSFDWRIDRADVPKSLDRLRDSPRFLPRVGEIVLYVRESKASEYVAFDTERKTFGIWDRTAQAFHGLPAWEAGLVTEVPQETIQLSDLVMEDDKQHQINYSGFRIEPLPKAGSDDKSWSKRSVYKPLHLIRPFIFYKDHLKGLRPVDWHPTMGHALSVMSSVCLVEKYHFKGVWPTATVFNKGIYLGAELLVVGDIVRLMPSQESDPTHVTNVMQITSIKMKLINLNASSNPDFDPLDEEDERMHRDYSTCVHICGVAYTIDPTRAWGMGKLPISVSSGVLPQSIQGFVNWYPLHDPERRWEIPFMQVLGRCYEDEAMRLWFSRKSPSTTLPPVSTFATVNRPTSQDADAASTESELGKGLRAIEQARLYSVKHDDRIGKTDGKKWFWADTRIEQLDLHEYKGYAVNKKAEPDAKSWRNIKAWKRAHKIREKGAGFAPKPGQGMAGRGPGRPKFASSMMAASAMGPEASGVDDMDTDTGPEPLQEVAGIGGLVGTENIEGVGEDEQEDEDDEDIEMVDAPDKPAAGVNTGRIDLATISSDSEEEDDDVDDGDSEAVADKLIDQLARDAPLPSRQGRAGPTDEINID